MDIMVHFDNDTAGTRTSKACVTNSQTMTSTSRLYNVQRLFACGWSGACTVAGKTAVHFIHEGVLGDGRQRRPQVGQLVRIGVQVVVL